MFSIILITCGQKEIPLILNIMYTGGMNVGPKYSELQLGEVVR
jgi:hypothetical protein